MLSRPPSRFLPGRDFGDGTVSRLPVAVPNIHTCSIPIVLPISTTVEYQFQYQSTAFTLDDSALNGTLDDSALNGTLDDSSAIGIEGCTCHR